MTLPRTSYDLNRIEHSAVLTGLRLLQEHLDDDNLSDALDDILTNCGTHRPITAVEIDDLCDRINHY